jgi:hypothetical protein
VTAEIVALDQALARAGEDVIIRRKAGAGANQVNVDVKCRAAVRTVSADQIAGTITQNDMTVIISPTQILAAQWPGGVHDGSVATDVDPRIPRITDHAVLQGKQRQVKTSKPIFVGGVWVRTDLVVAG